LLGLLQERSQSLRNVAVRPANKGSWDERIRAFGCEVAPLLMSLLSGSRCVGLAWGRTVSAAISGVERLCESPPARPDGPLVCVATVGGMVGELKVRAESSSSILASRLADTVNGNWESLYTLHGIQAFLSYVDSSDEIPIIKKHIAQLPNFQAIFGGPGRPGVINELDAIVTSCGNAHHFNQFWTTELPRLGVSPEKFNRITDNIGGVPLAKEGLSPEDEALLRDISGRWTGVTRKHYEQCALRHPGVILLAIGNNKAEVVLKCVELGLVNELIIDEDLATALWDLVDPKRRYPRTLEAVLCRQVSVERPA
jgi:DNA-binding transcriptional regulator LsrR (DeoR family)